MNGVCGVGGVVWWGGGSNVVVCAHSINTRMNIIQILNVHKSKICLFFILPGIVHVCEASCTSKTVLLKIKSYKK